MVSVLRLDATQYSHHYLGKKLDVAFNPKEIVILTVDFPIIESVKHLKQNYIDAVANNDFPEDKIILEYLDQMIKNYAEIFTDLLDQDSEIACNLDFTFVNSYLETINDLIIEKKARNKRGLDGEIYEFIMEYKKFADQIEIGNLSPSEKAEKQAMFFTQIDSFRYDKLNYIHTIFLDLQPSLNSESSLSALRNKIKNELKEKFGDFLLSDTVSTRAGLKRKLIEDPNEDSNKIRKIIQGITDYQSEILDTPSSSDLRTPRDVDSSTEKMDMDTKQLRFIAKNLTGLIKSLYTALSLEIEKIFNIFESGSVQELNNICNSNFLDIERNKIGTRTKLSAYSEKIEGQELITVIFCSKLKCYRLKKDKIAFQVSTGQYCLKAEKLFNDCYKCIESLTLNHPKCDSAFKPSEECTFQEIDFISAEPTLINGDTALLIPKENFIIQNTGNKTLSYQKYEIKNQSYSLKVGRDNNLTFFLENHEITKMFDMKNSLFSKMINFITDTEFYDEIIYTSSALSAIGIVITIIQFVYFSLMANKKPTSNILSLNDAVSQDRELMPIRKKTRFKIIRQDVE